MLGKIKRVNYFAHTVTLKKCSLQGVFTVLYAPNVTHII